MRKSVIKAEKQKRKQKNSGKTKMHISYFSFHKIESEKTAGWEKGGVTLNEKQKEIVDQYDVKVAQDYRNRGCLYLMTDRGLMMITAYYESPLRLALEWELQKRLSEAGFCQLDRIVANREEGLISYDKYRTPYIMKKAWPGKECNLKEEKDVVRALGNLGRFHRACRMTADFKEEKRRTQPVPILLRNRSRELKRIRNYIKKSGRKTEFELLFTACYEKYYEESTEVLKLCEQQPDSFWEHGYGICHGAYHQHNVILHEEGIATLNVGQFHYNQQLLDLYTIMRKTMEKNQYSMRYMKSALEAYEKENELAGEDYLLLYILFSFPEKFWKISNQYMNSKKCWMPPKNLEKLKKNIDQNVMREAFLKEWKTVFL